MMLFSVAIAVIGCGFHGSGATRADDAHASVLQTDDSTEDLIQIASDSAILECSLFEKEYETEKEELDRLKKYLETAETKLDEEKKAEKKCETCYATLGYVYSKTEPPVCELDCGESYVLCPGESLENNEKVTSKNGDIILTMQDDGNLVMYKGTEPKWQTMTNYAASNKKLWKKGVFIFQKDYNAVIYPEEFSSDKKMIKNPKVLTNVGKHVGGAWTKEGDYIEGSGGEDHKDIQLETPSGKSYVDCDATCRIILQDDCNLVLYKGGPAEKQEVIWATGAKCA